MTLVEKIKGRISEAVERSFSPPPEPTPIIVFNEMASRATTCTDEFAAMVNDMRSTKFKPTPSKKRNAR